MADPGWGEGDQDDRWRNGPPSQPPPTVPFVASPPPPPAAYPPPPPGYPAQPGYYQPVYVQPVLYPQFIPVMAPAKSKIAAALLAFFLGTFGIHNFYLGRTGLGVTQLLLATIGGILTCGVATICVGVWAFVECIVILCGGIKDRYGRPLT